MLGQTNTTQEQTIETSERTNEREQKGKMFLAALRKSTRGDHERYTIVKNIIIMDEHTKVCCNKKNTAKNFKYFFISLLNPVLLLYVLSLF